MLSTGIVVEIASINNCVISKQQGENKVDSEWRDK